MGVLGKGAAKAIAWSPNGSMLAVGSSAGALIYDALTWQMLQSVPVVSLDQPAIYTLTFSPDNKSLIFTSGYQTSFWKYDLQSRQLNPWQENISYDPHSAPLFSPDGATFAFINYSCEEAENDGDKCLDRLELHKSISGELLFQLQVSNFDQNNEISIFAFSPDSKQIAVGSNDNLVKIWDIASGKLLHKFQHDSDITDLSFNPDGKVLASASEDATVRFWDMQTGENLYILRGFEQGLQHVAYIENGNKLLIGWSYDNRFQEYSLDSNSLPVGLLNITMNIEETISYYSWQGNETTSALMHVSPDTHKMATLVNSKIQIWDLETGKSITPLSEYNNEIFSMKFSPDGGLLAVADDNVHLWRVSPYNFITTLEVNGYKITDMAFHPDGKRLAVSTYSENVEIWDIVSRRKIREIDPGCTVGRLAYSPDGNQLAFASQCEIQIWDAETGILKHKFLIDSYGPLALAFSEDGNHLFYVAENGRWGWNILSGQPLYAVKTTSYDDYYTSVGLRPNLGVMGREDVPVQFFNPITGKHLYEVASREGSNFVALSPTGRLLALADYENIDLVDSASGKDLLSIDFYLPYFIVFSPDNKMLAASSYDLTIHLWDIASVINLSAKIPPITATPAPTITSTPTETPEPIIPLALQPSTPPAITPGAISAENVTQLEKLEVLGLGRANTAAWSPDGKSLVIGGLPGAYIFRSGALQPSQFLPTNVGLVLLAFSPDGRILAGQISNTAIQVWDMTTGHVLYKLDDLGCWNDDMSFSSDSLVLSARCGDVTYRWSMTDGQLINKNQKNLYYSDITPDRTLAVQVTQNNAHLINTSSREIIKTFEAPGMATALAKFSPDGKTLLVWFYQFEIGRTGVYFPGKEHESVAQLWNIIPGDIPTLRATLSTGKWYSDSSWFLEAFQGLAFTLDNLRLATAGGDGWIRIWDTKSGRLLHTLPGGNRIYFSPDGNQLISLGKAVQIWDILQGNAAKVNWTIPGFSGYASLLMFTQDGKELVNASVGAFQFYSQVGIPSAEQPIVIQVPGTSTDKMSVSPDGKWLAYSTIDEIILGQNNPSNPGWRTLEKFTDHPEMMGASALSFSPDSSLLAVSSPDRKVLLWKPDRPESKPVELAIINFNISELHFSPNGKLLLGSDGLSYSTTLYLWDIETGELLRTWKIAEGYQLAFHPDGVTVAVTNYQDGTIRLIDLRTGTTLHELKGNPNVYDIAFSPDGSLLVTSSEERIEFWDVATGKLVRVIGGVFSRLAFSPDGKILVFGTLDGRIQCWSLPAR
jgi:WD40 repeat protein